MTTTLLCIFLYVVLSPHVVLSLIFTKLQLPPGGFGPDSFAFETPGGNFFTGLADGRIVKYEGLLGGFMDDFALTSPQWSKGNCVGRNDANSSADCGRPYGLAYNPSNRILYIADAYRGLLAIGPAGGIASPLATSAEGQPFRLLDGLDIDPRTEILYFTDSSTVYGLRDIDKIKKTNDSTGRLMKYDPATKQVTVLMRNLSSPAGVAVSSSGSSVIVSEYMANNILRFWITGPKANTYEILVTSITKPININRSQTPGQLLVAAATGHSGTMMPAKVTIDEISGRVLNVVKLEEYGNNLVTEVQPSGIVSHIVGSTSVNFVGVYILQP